jgi:hypothetical protein
VYGGVLIAKEGRPATLGVTHNSYGLRKDRELLSCRRGVANVSHGCGIYQHIIIKMKGVGHTVARYFAFSCAIKYDVTSVTIVEKNPEIIQLFNDCILPYFPNPDKILIKQGDAIEFMSNPDTTDFNLIFCDLWHDVSDGIPLWEELKKCEKNFKNSKFYYWIEQSMKYYI